MITAKLCIALLITCAPTWCWLERLVPARLPGRGLLIAGFALVLGMLATTLVMRLLGLLDTPFSLYSIGGVALAFTLAALLAPAPWRTPAITGPPAAHDPVSPAQRVFIALCLALLASRLLALGLEVATRPVTAWDAMQHWTKQARVFFALRDTVPYVSLEDWLNLGGQGVYTNMHPDYPIATPLLQAWAAIALGQWHESLVNLPWLLAWAACGLVFYSQAKLAGAGTATALAGTYLLLSMPYLNIHVALAGYADLLLGAVYLCAVAAFYNWSRRREPWLLLLALTSGAGCLLVKNEGFYWLLSLFPGIALVLLGRRKGLLCLAVVAGVLAAVLWLLPQDMVIAGHTLADTDLRYRPESWTPLYLSFLVHDNWHFLGYLAIASLLTAPLFARETLPLAAVVASALSLYLTLYLFTAHAFGAVNFTSLNRVALQLMPAVAFFCLSVFISLSNREKPH